MNYIRHSVRLSYLQATKDNAIKLTVSCVLNHPSPMIRLCFLTHWCHTNLISQNRWLNLLLNLGHTWDLPGSKTVMYVMWSAVSWTLCAEVCLSGHDEENNEDWSDIGSVVWYLDMIPCTNEGNRQSVTLNVTLLSVLSGVGFLLHYM